MKISSRNKYTRMQKAQYALIKDPIYDALKEHNAFKGYKYLFKDLKTKNKIALDFGCGLGRGIKLYSSKFKRIDGADINPRYIKKCRSKFLNSKFYTTNGVKLNRIMAESYDVVYSTTVLQHIPVWKIRYSLLEDIYRVLKPGGWLTAQMGFGENITAKNYYANYWEAEGTNSKCDVQVDYPLQIEADLTRIGFKNFKYWITDHGPSDRHPNWIFFRSQR